jgi:flagellar assembly factor FliW
VTDLDLKSEEDAVISVIITIPSNPQNMTANLKAPLVFNLKNRRGKQLVVSSSSYTTRHNIMEEIKKQATTGTPAAMQEAIAKAKASQDSAAQESEKAATGSSKK